MVAEKRHAPAAVGDFLDRDPWAWDFFQAVRRIECQCQDAPRVGTSLHPREDPVRFGQEPTLAFPPTCIAALRRGHSAAPLLSVHFLGLLGCSGPMPLHFTDYVEGRLRRGDTTLRDFLDMFHNRMIAFFYRAWAIHQQAVSHDRDDDRFGGYVASLIGIGMESLSSRDAVPDVAKLHYSGLLAGATRHAAGLRAILEGYLGVSVAVRQFVGQWLVLPDAYRCRMGESIETASLGENTMVGARVWDCQQRFRLRLGPMSLEDYVRFLPGTDGLRRLVTWVCNYCGLELEWELQLVLLASDVPKFTLGRGKGASLGHTTWLHATPPTSDADDLVLGPGALDAMPAA